MMIRKIAAGAVGGCLATVPMTAVMKIWPWLSPSAGRYPLPPREVTMRTLRRAGSSPPQGEAERALATYATHFGVGTTAGAVYGAALLELPVPPAVSGAAFGLGVWATSYLGLLPATDIIPGAHRRPAAWHALLAASHVVWGATTGVIAASLAGQNGHGRHDSGDA